MITPHNPFKDKADLFEDELRLAWVQSAIAGFPKFKASDFEFNLPQPTYTIHTLRQLQQTFPDRSFYLIMGADNWLQIDRWKESQSLLKEFPILVYPRKGYTITIPAEYKQVQLVDSPLFEISSTFIREAIKAGKDIRFFLPECLRNEDLLHS